MPWYGTPGISQQYVTPDKYLEPRTRHMPDSVPEPEFRSIFHRDLTILLMGTGATVGIRTDLVGEPYGVQYTGGHDIVEEGDWRGAAFTLKAAWRNDRRS